MVVTYEESDALVLSRLVSVVFIVGFGITIGLICDRR
jgi:hypothetical protein